MHMLMLVLDDPKKLDDVLDAWTNLGIHGATIVESTGYYRRRSTRRIGARYLFGAPHIDERTGKGQFTLFAILPDEATVRRCIEAAETITGDFDDPNTGIAASWELGVVKGVLETPKEDDES